MSRESARPMSCSSCGAPLATQIESADIPCAHCGRRHNSIVPPPPNDTPETAMGPGDAVAVKWGKRWWPARIIEQQSRNRYWVRYDGWGPKFDESVDRTRIRALAQGQEMTTGMTAYGHGIPKRTLSLFSAAAALVVLGGLAMVQESSIALVQESPDAPTTTAPNLSRVSITMSAPENSRPITEDDRLTPKQRVLISMESVWYPAEITSVMPDRRVRVRFHAHDMIVPRERLRLRP